MPYKNVIKAIYNRTHLAENKEKYHNLINHTSTIKDGEKFISRYDRAAEISQKEELSQEEVVEIEAIIKHLNDWLDTNKWA